MGLKREQQTKIYEKYWLPIENACTEKESNSNKVSDFIRHFLTIETQEIPNKDKVYQAFKKKYACTDDKFFEEILTKIKNYSLYYNKLINPKNEPDKEIIQQVAYINKLEITVSYPFLLEVYHDYETNAAILILTNLGATTESCPYKYGKYLPIIGDFRGVGAGLRARPVKISFS